MIEKRNLQEAVNHMSHRLIEGNLPSPEFSPMSKSCPSFASGSNAWQTGFELLKCIDFIGSYIGQ